MIPRCMVPGCPEPPAARISFPQLPGAEFVIVRPATSHAALGDLVCVDHAHHAVDQMLMQARPEPGR